MQFIISVLLSGIAVGGQYALIAIGYTMVYGILRLINFAHGDVFMVAGLMGIYFMVGVQPENLKLKELLQRLQREDIKEVIIATNSTVEGEATALWISKYVKQAGIKVTRIASGVPVGGALEFIDEMTLFRALEGRTEL